MLTNRKYSGRRPLVVVAALLSLMILLPLAGCKNDTVPEPTRYTVKFDKNAEDATGEMAPLTFTDGIAQKLTANGFSRPDYGFAGWAESAEGTVKYSDREEITVTKDITLYAVWTDNGTVASVTFTPADGTTLYYGDTVTLATATEGATIQYKLGDGSWQDYTVGTPISVTTSTTITAKATKDGLKDSTETKATYTLRQLTTIIVTPPTRTVYSVGDSFDMTVTATYDDKTTREVTESATTDFATVAGEKGLAKTVTVSYKEGDTTQTDTFTVDVASYKFTEAMQDVDSGYTGTASSTSYPAVSNPIYKKFGDWPQTVMGEGVKIGTGTLVRGGLTYHVGSDGNYYVKEGDKYYKVEPIVWRVLNKDYATTGTVLLLAENILTGGVPYYVDTNQRTIGSQTVYANNYQYSTVRAWLNGKYESDDTQAKTYTGKGFLQTAFTQSAQNLIATTTVDNSAESTTDAGGNLTQATNYACGDTVDKIFLLSEKEATTTEYGFAVYNQYGEGSTRIRAATDYAKATGANQSSIEVYGGYWWLRSPHYYDNIYVRYVEYTGSADHGGEVSDTWGVVPALCVELW